MKNKKLLIILDLMSALMLIFSFPNFIEKGVKYHTFLLGWIAMAPIFIVFIKAKNKKEIFWYGYLAAGIFYLGSLYWLCFVKVMGIFAYISWLMLSLFMALYIVLSLIFARLLKEILEIEYLFSVPLLYTVLDFFRERVFTGFPLLSLAQSQQGFAYVLQVLKFTGMHGLNFLMASFGLIISFIITGTKTNLKKTENIMWAVITLGLLALLYASNMPDRKNYEQVRVSLLQADTDQNVAWDKNYKAKTMEIYQDLTQKALKDKPRVFIWSETAYPGALNMEPEAGKVISGWSKGLNAYNIVGSDMVVTSSGGYKYYNSAFLVSPKGSIIGDYSKYHLVPLGEYIPLADVFTFVQKVVRRYGYESFTKGSKISPLALDGKYFGVLICYDSLFPEISRDFVRKGAEFLVHLSYETWYGNTPASAQIFTDTALRAVENDVYIARCVESGISGIVNNKGQITLATKLFERTAASGDIYIKREKLNSLYTMLGDWFIYLLIILLVAVIIIRLAVKKTAPTAYEPARQ